MIIDRFQPYQHNIALGDVCRMGIDFHGKYTEVSVTAVYTEAVFLYIRIITMAQKTHLSASMSQTTAIIAPYGSCSYYCIIHHIILIMTCKGNKYFRFCIFPVN